MERLRAGNIVSGVAVSRSGTVETYKQQDAGGPGTNVTADEPEE